MIALIALLSMQGAAPEVRLIGGTPEQVRSLAAYLGSGYRVGRAEAYAPSGSSVADRPKAVVVVPSVPTTESGFEGYVPRLRQSLVAYRAYGPAVYVCVPPSASLSAFVGPLTRQAAREAGVKAIEIPDAASFAESVGESVLDPTVEKAGWKVVSSDSEQIDEGPASKAIDGDLDTYWHTRYEPTTPKHPHEIVVDMGKPLTFSGFRYVPRQDGGVNGRVKGFEFYVSADGRDWGKAVATGSLPNTNKPTLFRFANGPASGRYFRFVATSEQNGGPWTTAAEIDVLRVRP